MNPNPTLDGVKVYKTTRYPLARYSGFIVAPVSTCTDAAAAYVHNSSQPGQGAKEMLGNAARGSVLGTVGCVIHGNTSAVFVGEDTPKLQSISASVWQISANGLFT